MKRGSSGLCGILSIDKPSGITSHDVVDCVRRLTGERRVGHAGTLDPMATGLMLVGVGAATRLTQYLTGHDKSYRARMVFGATTDTDDLQGRILHVVTGLEETSCLGSSDTPSSMPAALANCEDQDFIKATIDGLVGVQQQLPPAYSAIKKGGVTAYKAARDGKSLDLEPRTIRVDRARLIATGRIVVSLVDADGAPRGFEMPYWDVDLDVSKGTYIRSIARDLGQDIGCGAFLGALRRTAISGYGIERAVSLEKLSEMDSLQDLPWCDPVELLGMPRVELDAAELESVSNGREFASSSSLPDGTDVCCVHDGRLMAVYTYNAGVLKPATVISGGVVGVR